MHVWIYEIQEEDSESTLLFEDGVRKIDYILTYTNTSKEFDKNHDEDDDHDNKTMRRNTFLDKFKEHGLDYEIQDCSVCINSTVMMSRLQLYRIKSIHA